MSFPSSNWVFHTHTVCRQWQTQNRFYIHENVNKNKMRMMYCIRLFGTSRLREIKNCQNNASPTKLKNYKKSPTLHVAARHLRRSCEVRDFIRTQHITVNTTFKLPKTRLQLDGQTDRHFEVLGATAILAGSSQHCLRDVYDMHKT
jgi:hypothetical protein